MKIIGIIPARYKSVRFPGKPLALIGDKSMVRHVFEKAKQAKELSEVIVATDDERIAEHVQQFGGKTIMTSEVHTSGTERCAEAAVIASNDFDAVINIQGDEPFIDQEQINKVARLLKQKAEIATLAEKITDENDLFNPGVVKMVMDTKGRAMYFSRQCIPFYRNAGKEEWLQMHEYYRHTGIYGYRLQVLLEIVRLPPAPLENAELLEQLRWIENGYSITTEITHYNGISVDTPADLEKANIFYNKKG